MGGSTIPQHLRDLSDDAKAVAGGHFGMMRPGVGTLTFNTPSRITARAKDALVELTEAGVCTHRVLPSGAWVYTPAIACGCFMWWLAANSNAGRFPCVTKDGAVPTSHDAGEVP